MNSENGQIKKRPVSQTGTGLVKYIWAAGDYAAVVAAEFLALFLRNFFMDYSVFHVAPVYFWLITPMIFLLFLSVNQMYGRQMLFYQAVEKIFSLVCTASSSRWCSCSPGRSPGRSPDSMWGSWR